MYRIKMLVACATVFALAACSDIAGVSRSAAEAPFRLDGAPAVVSSSPTDSTAAISGTGTLGSGYSVATNGNGTLGSGY